MPSMCDAGVIDGLGQNGRASFGPCGEQVITFMIDGGVPGEFPGHAGIVLTDKGDDAGQGGEGRG